MRTVKHFAAGVLASSLALAAFAGVSNRGHFEWDTMEVNLQSGPTLPILAHVFRLHFVANETVQVNGFSLGAAANPGLTPERLLFSNGAAFNHAFGSDIAPNPALIPAFPELAFDSYFAMGDQAVAFVPGSVAFDNTIGVVLGTWFTQPPLMMNPGDRLFALQLTILLDSVSPIPSVGGAGSSIEVGFADNTTAVFDIPFAQIPSPGAFAALALGALGALAAHRRRS